MATVVILDDELSTLNALHHVATKLGHSVFSFSDPVSAIKAIEAQKTDFLITDWELNAPLSGIYVASFTLALYPNSKVVLISGGDMARLKRQTDRLPNITYIAKPFDLNTVRKELLQVVQ